MDLLSWNVDGKKRKSWSAKGKYTFDLKPLANQAVRLMLRNTGTSPVN